MVQRAPSGEVLLQSLANSTWPSSWATTDWAAVRVSATVTSLRQLFEATQATQQAGQDSCRTISGCMFGNLSLEMSNQTEAVRERLQEIFEAQVEMVEATS